MTPVIHCSIGNITLVPRIVHLTRCGTSEKETRLKPSKRFLLPRSSLKLFQMRSSRLCSGIQTVAAVGADLTVEETNPTVSGEVADESSEAPPRSDESIAPATENPTTTSSKTKRFRPGRKSEMPHVNEEELVPGALFVGKVMSIQPFGCFVDFGAYTDGLVHVSRMTDGYVKDVASVVSIGQEVKVRIVEANKETRRISLTMRDKDDPTKIQQRQDSTVESGQKTRPSRRNSSRSRQKHQGTQKSTMLATGQVLDGTVKNLTRSGAFVSLPEGEEGFLPVTEESEGFGGILGSSSLQVGQEVNVRVLRIARGQVTLTMKEEEDVEELNKQLNQGVVHVATNAFQLAFRKNKEIAAFLAERERAQKSPEKVDNSEVENSAISQEDQLVGSSDSAVEVDDQKSINEELPEETPALDSISNISESKDEESFGTSSETADTLVQEDDKNSDILSQSSPDSVLDEEPLKDDIEDSSDTVEVGDITSEGVAVEEGESSLTIDGKEAIDDIKASEETEDALTSEEAKASLADEVKETEALAQDSVLDEEPLKDDIEDSSDTVEVGDITSEGVAVEEGESSSTINGKEAIDNIKASEETEDALTSEEAKSSLADDVKDTEALAQDSVLDEDPLKDDIEDSSDTVEVGDITSEGVAVEEGEPSLTIDGKEAIDDIKASEETEEALTSEEAKASLADEVKETGALAQDEQSFGTPGSAEKEDLVNSIQVEDSTGELDTKNGAGPLSDQNLSTESVALEDPGSSESDKPIATEDVAKESNVLIKNGTVSDSNDARSKAQGSLNGKTGASDDQSSVKATISPVLVKQLREETGAGMMDCKNALAETGGDIVEAQEFLRKKGLASADKKSSRVTAEGRIGSYIHDSRIGVLIEVNCETDFVSRGEIFKELVDDLAMQVAACPQVRYLVTEDVPEEIVTKEKEIEMQKEDLLTKPENIRSKIVDGRIQKRLEELALLEQPYIKNDKMVVKDYVKQTIATLGENIKVKRFVRYNLGEGLEKKSQDFAAEVAAQTAAKSSPAAPKDEPTIETNEVVEKPKTVAVSAALVKQLREETGAGMMDCKKALSESAGDLEKAQEYLRKKGLSSADKKSSRLAAEGRISSYIHDSRIGVLIEVNCETDFVGRNEKFKELVDDLAMQVVACPQVEFVSTEDIPESIITKEKEIEMQRDDLMSKPDQIKEKIVEGRIAKRLGELALLEQPFIRDDSIKVKDLVKQTVASLGENIKLRRFVRFTLGES